MNAHEAYKETFDAVDTRIDVRLAIDRAIDRRLLTGHDILVLYLLLVQERSFAEAGRVLGVSRQRVHQIYVGIKNNLKMVYGVVK